MLTLQALNEKLQEEHRQFAQAQQLLERSTAENERESEKTRDLEKKCRDLEHELKDSKEETGLLTTSFNALVKETKRLQEDLIAQENAGNEKERVRKLERALQESEQEKRQLADGLNHLIKEAERLQQAYKPRYVSDTWIAFNNPSTVHSQSTVSMQYHSRIPVLKPTSAAKANPNVLNGHCSS